MRRRFRALLLRLHVLPALSGELETVIEKARLRAGETVADVGAKVTVAAAERVAPDGDVFALDVSVDALEELRRACTAPNVFYFLGSANVLPLPDDAVDAVLTLTELHDKPEAAREFLRVLRSGGRISICEPANDDLEQVFREAGFGDVRSDGTETAVYVTGTKP